MFKLFGKKEGSLEDQLAACRQKKGLGGAGQSLLSGRYIRYGRGRT